MIRLQFLIETQNWRICFISIALLLACLLPIRAQDSIDDLFSDPSTGIIDSDTSEADDENSNETSSEEETTGQSDSGPIDPNAIGLDKRPRFSFNTTLSGGLLIGLDSWTNPFEDSSTIDFSPYGSYDASLALDYRPRADVAAHVSLETDFPNLSIVLDELFIDYTLAQNYEFRIGKHDMTWGQGQILNPADFVDDAIDSIGIKAFAPLGRNGLTAVVFAELDGLDDDAFDAVHYAAQFADSIGSVSYGASAAWTNTDGLESSVFAKTAIVGVDSALESIIHWGDFSGDLAPDVLVLSSFFWEGGDPPWQIVGEYLFDSSVEHYEGHEAAAGIIIKDLFSNGWKPAVIARHRFSDNTGAVVLGFDGRLAPSVDMTIGLPIRYGSGDPVEFPDLSGFDEIPGSPVVALVVQFSISLGYRE